MAKTKISEFSSTPANNTDIDSINLAEGCAPSGINDAIRELMSQLKDWQSGASNDPYVIGSSGSLTLNQGTANGVLYLNGSKVATSGSALTFDGTNYLNVTGLRIGGTDTTNTIYQATGALALSTGSTSPITFNVNVSEGMRLTSTGLGIGTSSPATKLHVNGTGASIRVSSNTSTSGTLDLSATSTEAVVATNNYGSVVPLVFKIDGTERMRIDSSGNLGIGTTSPSSYGKLAVAGNAALNTNGQLKFYNSGNNNWSYIDNPSTDSTAYMRFATGGGEAMRIDSSGNLLVGTTSANGLGGTTLNSGYALWNSSSNNTTRLFFWYNGSAVGTVTTTGTSTAYNTSSDQRLKENIQDADSASSLIDGLQVRKFDWKSDGSHQRYGFVAQELVTVAPEAVHQPEDTEEMMAVDYSKLVPMLVKEIQSLRVRVAQLESN